MLVIMFVTASKGASNICLQPCLRWLHFNVEDNPNALLVLIFFNVEKPEEPCVVALLCRTPGKLLCGAIFLHECVDVCLQLKPLLF